MSLEVVQRGTEIGLRCGPVTVMQSDIVLVGEPARLDGETFTFALVLRTGRVDIEAAPESIARMLADTFRRLHAAEIGAAAGRGDL